MAISIYKIIDAKTDAAYTDGKVIVKVILDDGTNKRVCYLGGVKSNDVDAKKAILDRAEELFKIGYLRNEGTTGIDCPSKTFSDNFKSLEEVTADLERIANIEDVKKFLKKVTNSIFALRDIID